MRVTLSRATNSLQSVKDAVTNPSITTIECDVLIGVAKEQGTNFYETPILARPPNRESDISVAALLLQVLERAHTGEKVLKKNLMLDFHEIGAVEPALDFIEMTCFKNLLQRTITFHADILPGPGRRKSESVVDPDQFLTICHDFVEHCEMPCWKFEFSLGFRCNGSSGEPYTKRDAALLAHILRRHPLKKVKAGLVLSLNGHLLANSVGVFDSLLREFPEWKVLISTDVTGQSITQVQIDAMRQHFQAQDMLGRVNFDCTAGFETEGSSNTLHTPHAQCAFSFASGLVAGFFLGVVAVSCRRR